MEKGRWLVNMHHYVYMQEELMGKGRGTLAIDKRTVVTGKKRMVEGGQGLETRKENRPPRQMKEQRIFVK